MFLSHAFVQQPLANIFNQKLIDERHEKNEKQNIRHSLSVLEKPLASSIGCEPLGS